MDLTVDLQPPKGLFISVQILKDLGEVILGESGPVKLVKNQRIDLRRGDADHLIRQGKAKEVKDLNS